MYLYRVHIASWWQRSSSEPSAVCVCGKFALAIGKKQRNSCVCARKQMMVGLLGVCLVPTNGRVVRGGVRAESRQG
jgi:hypothetical protein